MKHWIPLLGLLFLFSACSSTRPTNLGVENGRLTDCPTSPNCISTQSAEGDRAYMKAWPFSGDQAATKAKLLKIIKDYPRTTIVEDKSNYLHVEFVTKIMRFTDDVIFYLDDQNKMVHFRSASRVGRSDLGANRERMTELEEFYKK